MPPEPEHPQDKAYTASLRSPQDFWSYQASQLTWTRPPSSAYSTHTRTLPSGSRHESWSWFPDGEISTSYNCVDRHVEAGNGDAIAIIWDSPVTGQKQEISYKELQEEIAVLAGVLREEGVKRGDVVLIYMPMIPAALVGILATVRLGAIHAVVFGGFSAQALAQRIEASRPKCVLTASCGVEGAKGVLRYAPMVRGARKLAKERGCEVSRTIVWERREAGWGDWEVGEGEREWQSLVKGARERGVRAGNVGVGSGEGLYIIYTSGTTGLPKGVLREAGGHAVGLNLSIRYIFGIRGPGDVLFTASDIGWVVGHSYIIYAPLLAGATTVLFEGKPVGTPSADTFWRICEENRVNALFCAPTALRAIRKEDPQNKFFTTRGKRGGLKSLRALFLAGERSEPSIVSLYQSLLASHGAPQATVIDNWWSSESGSPMTGLALLPATATDFTDHTFHPPLPIKPGSAGKPAPGFDIRIVDDSGNELPRGEMGNIVLATPLAPTGLTTLWKDPERFYNGYLKRFKGKWIDTGDAGMVDTAGYVHVMARSDDILNVAAHRLSTGQIEQAIATHPLVTECAVVPLPDELKGQVPFAFVALSAPSPPETLRKDLNARLRESIGPIASLGGVIAAPGVIPKTRSGKTLRRTLRELVENAARGEFGKEVGWPSTIEDPAVVERARGVVRGYFEKDNGAKAKL